MRTTAVEDGKRQTTARRTLLIGAVIVSAAIVVAAVGLYVAQSRATSACNSTPTSDGLVAMPPGNASPTDVIEAFAKAVTVGDYDTAAELTDGSTRWIGPPSNGNPSPLGHYCTLDSIRNVTRQPRDPSADAERTVLLRADMRVELKGEGYYDDSWGPPPATDTHEVGVFVLVRASASAPWRIANFSGPYGHG